MHRGIVLRENETVITVFYDSGFKDLDIGVGSMAMVFRLKVAGQKKQFRPSLEPQRLADTIILICFPAFYAVTISGFHLSAGSTNTHSITFPSPCSAEHS